MQLIDSITIDSLDGESSHLLEGDPPVVLYLWPLDVEPAFTWTLRLNSFP